MIIYLISCRKGLVQNPTVLDDKHPGEHKDTRCISQFNKGSPIDKVMLNREKLKSKGSPGPNQTPLLVKCGGCTHDRQKHSKQVTDVGPALHKSRILPPPPPPPKAHETLQTRKQEICKSYKISYKTRAIRDAIA